MTKTLASLALGLFLLAGNAVPDKAATPPKATVHRALAAQDSDTETVLSTFRPRAGKEDELLKTMGKNWSTLSKLGLVLQQPHIVLRGKDDAGKTIFVELLTWRDHEAGRSRPRRSPGDLEPIAIGSGGSRRPSRNRIPGIRYRLGNSLIMIVRKPAAKLDPAPPRFGDARRLPLKIPVL